jgi:hypothetical protein
MQDENNWHSTVQQPPANSSASAQQCCRLQPHHLVSAAQPMQQCSITTQNISTFLPGLNARLPDLHEAALNAILVVLQSDKDVATSSSTVADKANTVNMLAA